MALMDGLASAWGADPFCSSSFSPDTNKHTVSCWHPCTRTHCEHTLRAWVAGTPHIRVHFPFQSHGQGDSHWVSIPQLEADVRTSARCGGLPKTACWLGSLQTPCSLSSFLHVASVRRVGRSSTNAEGWRFSCCFVLKLCGGKAHCLELA